METRLVVPRSALPEIDAAALLAELESVIFAPRASSPPPAKRARHMRPTTLTALPALHYMAGLFDERSFAPPDLLANAVAGALRSRCAGAPPARGWADGTSASFYSATAPRASLRAYIARVAARVRATAPVFVVAVVLLDRARTADPALALCGRNVHRALAAALAVAGKTIEDEPVQNAVLASAAGVPSTAELNELELQLLRRLEWRCAVPRCVFQAYEMDIFRDVPALCVLADVVCDTESKAL